MESEKDYIDKLYSEKFEKFEFQTSGDDWNAMNSKLGKSNFLKFSFATFNVFFLGALMAFAGTATYLGVTAINQSKKIEQLENKIEVLKVKENNNETSPLIIDSTIIEKQKEKQKPNNEINVSNFVKKEIPFKNIEVPPQLNSKKDSIYVTPDSTAVIKTETQKIKIVKKTTFIKKDKVILTDTIIIKKKEK